MNKPTGYRGGTRSSANPQNWGDSPNLAMSNSPGIGINVGGGEVVGEIQQFTLLDQEGAARTPQNGQQLGQLPAGIIAATMQDYGSDKEAPTIDGATSLTDLVAGWQDTADAPPPDVPDNLLTGYNDITGPTWDLAEQTATYQGDGWWEYAVTDGLTTTRSLVQFFEVGNVSVGNTYEIGARFRQKGAAGADYRLAVAEYDATTWRGATSSDLDVLPDETDEEFVITARRTVSDATSDRIRFAIQLVNPPAGSPSMSIQFQNPFALLVPNAAGGSPPNNYETDQAGPPP